MANELNLTLLVPTEVNAAGLAIRMGGTQERPLWCLKDVCAALGIESHRVVAGRLDDDEKDCVCLTDAMDRERDTTVVTEAGLYKVIIRSDKPEAKPFMRWLTHDVLPCIRKHGCYPAPAESPADKGREIVRAILREELAFLRDRPTASVALAHRPVELIDPREYTLRCWPEVGKRTLENIIRRMDALYRCNVGRAAPQRSDDPNARLMCEPEYLFCLTHAIAFHWRKEHPADEPELDYGAA